MRNRWWIGVIAVATLASVLAGPGRAHAQLGDTAAFLADLSVSGLELVDAPLVEPVLSGPAWLSGGEFGPEGSVLVTVVVFAAAAWIWRGGRRSVSEES